MKSLLRIKVIFSLSLLFLLSGLATAQNLTIENYELENKERVGRSEFNYTYKADVINTGAAVNDVIATVTSTSPNTVVVEDTLTFGDVPAESTVTSSDTFTIRHNRSVPFNPAVFVWSINAQLTNIHYRGNEIVLIRSDPNGFGPGAVVHFDLDGDEDFEEQVITDENGIYNISLDATQLQNNTFSTYTSSSDGTQESEITTVEAIQDSQDDPSSEVPVNLLPAQSPSPEPPISACFDECCCCDVFPYTNSYTPVVEYVELATGKVRWSTQLMFINTPLGYFNFNLYYASMVDYNGPVGQSFSHSFNMMIVQTGPLTGLIITPDLRIYEISSTDGKNWYLPPGFKGTMLTLDEELSRWTLIHYSGHKIVFYQGALGHPGYPIAVCDSNGNRGQLVYNNSGQLQRVITDLSQELTLGYNEDSRLNSFTDHMGRTWELDYDEQDPDHLQEIATPPTEYADIGVWEEITDTTLPGVLVTESPYASI